MMMPSDVKIPSDLSNVLGAIQGTVRPGISDAYGKRRSQLMQDARPNSKVFGNNAYASSRLNAGERMSNLGLEDALGRILSESSLGDSRAERDYGQNMELARMTGDLMRPSDLDTVLGVAGSGANLAGNIYGMYKNSRKPSRDPFENVYGNV
jgi:hypothetical protein